MPTSSSMYKNTLQRKVFLIPFKNTKGADDWPAPSALIFFQTPDRQDIKPAGRVYQARRVAASAAVSSTV
ncbi:hypothetical protein HK25_11045 [Acetobacter sp. DsW_059]|nr:hypothetical protein HK25_11045 [Acetobacter sp. DsW_059]